jgi:CXXC-20-CXXC protein
MKLYKCCKCHSITSFSDRFKSMFLNKFKCEMCHFNNEISIYSRVIMSVLTSLSISGFGYLLFSSLESIFLSMVGSIVFTLLLMPLYPFLITYDCEEISNS